MTTKKMILFITLTFFVFQNSAQAEMDPRIKALGSMALYGTAGGALLGTASLAFGGSGRSIARGASLGLYAGIIFGSYVVASHMMKSYRMKNPAREDNYYPDSDSPYEDEGDGYEGRDTYNQNGQVWDPKFEFAKYREIALSGDSLETTGKKTGVRFIVPVVFMQF